jgi:SAM-dependent methyltransferase
VYRLYRYPKFRERICRIRFLFLARGKSLRIGATENVLHKEYSGEHFVKYASHKNRVNFLIDLVKNSLIPNKNSLVLSVGPRFESELFGLRGLGFNWSQIKAVDTYSYSPLITPGNMHNLQFSESSFDLILAGWVLAYSDDPIAALEEFHRVLRPNGILILTWELPEEHKLATTSDMYLYRQKIIGKSDQLLPPISIFDLLIKTFKIQTLICSSINPNPDPTLIALTLRRGI